MRLRTVAFSLAPLLSASLVHAQAPGEVEASGEVVVTQPVVVAPVVTQPVVVAPVVAQPVVAYPAPQPFVAPESRCAPAVVHESSSVMNNRWAIGLSIGSMSLAPEGFPDDQTAFTVGELALRFRLTPHLELEASAGGGRERTADNEMGDLEVVGAALSARWRFRPEAAWNWYLMGGIGGAAIARYDATDEERDEAMQPFGMLGIGLERRFRHFALQAELRGVGMARKIEERVEDMPQTAEMSTTSMPAPSDPPARAGGSFTIGLSYYF